MLNKSFDKKIHWICRKAFLSIGLCLFYGNLIAQLTKGYNVNANITNLRDNVVVYLIGHDNYGGADTLQKTKTTKGSFQFIGFLEDSARLMFIKIDTSNLKLRAGQQSWLPIFLDNSNIAITGTLNNWPNLTIEGSKSTTEYNDFYSKNSEIIKKLYSEISIVNTDNEKKDRADSNYIKFLSHHFDSQKNSYVTPYLIKTAKGMSLNDKKNAFSKLTHAVKNSYYGQQLTQHIANLEMQKNLRIGTKLPDFLIKNWEGQEIGISKYIKRTRYLLIDFWAYWCQPCRTDLPEMKRTYLTFNKYGFDILSISIDPNKPKWIKSIKEEEIIWNNAMQKNNTSKELFNADGIPAYILVDSTATIIAMDIPRINDNRNNTLFLLNNQQKRLRGKDLYEVISSLLEQKKSPTNRGY